MHCFVIRLYIAAYPDIYNHIRNKQLKNYKTTRLDTDKSLKNYKSSTGISLKNYKTTKTGAGISLKNFKTTKQAPV